MNGPFWSWPELPEWDGDGVLTLKQLEEMIPILKKKYGVNSMIGFDAGANNVSVKIQPTKKKFK